MYPQRFSITQAKLNIMIEYMKKQELNKPLGQVFCEDYEISDHDIRYQMDDKKAAALILKRYAP